MSELSQVFSSDLIIIDCHIQSKKKALELLSKLIAEKCEPPISFEQIFLTLVEREKLGSTCLGHGIAIPHARIEGLSKPIGAVIHLFEEINFDDEAGPVKLLLGLALPADNKQLSLNTLAALVAKLKGKLTREAIFKSDTPEDLCNQLSHV